jgi:hydroxyacyl-ACP dehydratase HTD2-like protein with hotdog domain
MMNLKTMIVQLRLRKLWYSSCSHQRFSGDVQGLNKWISSAKSLKLVLPTFLSAEHVSDLFLSLPTRDGTEHTTTPANGMPLGYGHHLAFFHPRNPEHALRSDGTDGDFCPPEPFSRRMWAGGKIEWKQPLIIGDKATAKCTITSVDKKGFTNGVPMVFVSQKILIHAEGCRDPSVEEERTHVYLSSVRPKVGRKGMVSDLDSCQCD